MPFLELFDGNRWGTDIGHLVIEVARGLDPNVPHVVEIIPAFDEGKDQEVPLGSICLAGGAATAKLTKR